MTPTTEYAIGFSAGSAACMYVFRQVFAMVRENRREKEYSGNGNGESGKRPTAYWVAKFDSLDGHAQRQTQILERQTELLQEQGKALVELVTITRMQAKL